MEFLLKRRKPREFFLGSFLCSFLNGFDLFFVCLNLPLFIQLSCARWGSDFIVFPFLLLLVIFCVFFSQPPPTPRHGTSHPGADIWWLRLEVGGTHPTRMLAFLLERNLSRFAFGSIVVSACWEYTLPITIVPKKEQHDWSSGTHCCWNHSKKKCENVK